LTVLRIEEEVTGEGQWGKKSDHQTLEINRAVSKVRAREAKNKQVGKILHRGGASRKRSGERRDGWNSGEWGESFRTDSKGVSEVKVEKSHQREGRTREKKFWISSERK